MPAVVNASRPLIWAAALLAFIGLAGSVTEPTIGAQLSGSDMVFRKLVLERIRAYGRGDSQAYTAMLADGFIHISDLGERRTKVQMQAYVGGHGDDRASFTISSLSWFLKGDLAVVDAEVHERRADLELAQHETDIFIVRGARWLYLLHQETARWKAPIAEAAGDDRLDDYVGRYRTPAGTIDVITVRNRELFDQTLPSLAGEHFVHVANGAFGFSNDPTLAVFLRDATGEVTRCLWHLPSGQTIVSRRIE